MKELQGTVAKLERAFQVKKTEIDHLMQRLKSSDIDDLKHLVVDLEECS